MKRRVLAALLVVAALCGLGWARARREALHVDYYYIPHCMSCAQVKSALDAWKGSVAGRVEVRTIDCYSAEGLAAARKYGFVTHGIVVEKGGELLFEEKDHGVSADDVRVVVAAELARR
jgi:hypothetical protein